MAMVAALRMEYMSECDLKIFNIVKMNSKRGVLNWTMV